MNKIQEKRIRNAQKCMQGLYFHERSIIHAQQSAMRQTSEIISNSNASNFKEILQFCYSIGWKHLLSLNNY